MTNTVAQYPAARFRRNRKSSALRALQRENTLTADDLIWPIFIQDGKNKSSPIASMPGVDRLSIDLAVAAAERAQDLRIPAICLFPYIDASLKTESCATA